MAAHEAIEGADVAASMGIDDFKKIVQDVCNHTNGGDVKSAGAGSSEIGKQAYAFIMSILSNAVRARLDADALKQQLEEMKLPQSHIEVLITRLVPLVPSQRDTAPCSTSLPALVQSGWRLDFVTRTSASGKVNQQQYILRFITSDPETGALLSKEVAASKQQVEALHSSVGRALDAAHSLLPKKQKAKRTA